MQYILSELEMKNRKKKLEQLNKDKQKLVGELSEALRMETGCPAIGHFRGGYPCHECPVKDRCDYPQKFAHLPK